MMPRPTFHELLLCAQQSTGITVAAMMSLDRRHAVWVGRMHAIRRARTELGMSWPEIATAFDRTGHSTFIEAGIRLSAVKYPRPH